MNAKVEQLMKSLDISEAEAIEVIEADKKIDKGEKLFELSPELEAGAKKARQADRKPTVYNFDTKDRKRKADEDKAKLIAILAESLEQVEIIPTVTNPEREMEFTYNGRKFKLTLSAPRK